MNFMNEPTALMCYSDGRILLLSESHSLVDIKKQTIITQRTLSVKQDGNEIYALGSEGYVIYDLETGEEKLYENTGDMKSPYFGNIEFSYHRPTIHRIKSFNDFNEAEQDNFEEMFHLKVRNSLYAKPFYKSPFESTMLDVERGIEVCTVQSLKKVGNILYIYEGNGFTVISLPDGYIWQYYNNNLLIDNEIQFDHSKRIKRLERAYGDHYVLLDNLSGFGNDTLDVLFGIWKSYHVLRHQMDEDSALDVWKQIMSQPGISAGK
ncbi:hypothetical protein [uncultured Dialister sp.]|uniref:hypothetical protein n=1 Tax=uncultured Dialister sp. TaxID=278064 RepID=UPI00262F932F|nr:hypothetical protein [uncultured Dialister sp.]